MSSISRAVIRIRCDSQRFETPESDFLTGRTPGFWLSNDVQFEIARFNLGKDPAELLSVANLSSIKVEVKPAANRNGAALMAKTTADINAALTLEEWNDGSGQHAVVTFDHFESALSIPDGDNSADYWLVVSAITTTGEWITIYGGTMKVFRDGTPSDEIAPLQGGNVVPVDAEYDADGEYVLNVTASKLYSWTAQANDDAYNNGGGDITTDGNFTAAANTIVLKGTALAVVTAIVRSKVYLDAEESDARYLITRKRVTQTAHGLAAKDVVRFDGTNYVKALADTRQHAEVIGVVESAPSVNEFILVMAGGRLNVSGLTAGSVYFLSAATAGLATVTEPSTAGQVTKPVFLALSTAEALVLNYRGVELEDDEAGTVVNEGQFTGAVDGVNATFETEFPFVAGSPRVFLNGLRLSRIAGDYTEDDDQTITFATPPVTGDTLFADYVRA